MSESPGFLMVVGCQRSGTTLLGQMLGAHPDAMLVDEDEGAYRIVDAIRAGESVAALLDELLPVAARKYSDGRGIQARPRAIVLKAPNATFHADELQRSSLPLRFFFPVRDVREVVSSMLAIPVPIAANQRRRMASEPRLAERFRADIEQLDDPALSDAARCGIVWRLKTGLYRDFVGAPIDALLVRYDELVAHPAEWLRRLQRHAGLAPSEVRHHEVMRGQAIGRTQRGRAVDGSSRSLWREALGERDLQDLHGIAGPLMRELGMAW
jgi:hypothetical protein